MSRGAGRSASDHRSDLNEVYVLWSPRQQLFKIGRGDTRDRIKSFRTSDPSFELRAAIKCPSPDAIEKRLHAFFSVERDGLSEMFEPSDRLFGWVHLLMARPGVATIERDIDNSFPSYGVWPWQADALELEGQLPLDIDLGPYIPRIGGGEGQTSSMSEDWYTHKIYVEAAREVLGGIDLDPMSCPEANQVVQAHLIHTAETDGLRFPWKGRVFLNPPWGGGIDSTKTRAIAKLIREYEKGDVEAAVVVLNANAMTTKWFAPLLAYPVAIPNHRVKHYGPGGAGGAPNSGTVFIYLGPDVDAFVRVFSGFGAVVAPLASGGDAFAEDWEAP